MDPASFNMKMPASELKQNFGMIKGIMADNQRIICDVLEKLSMYILDNKVEKGCEDLIIASLHLSIHSLKSGKLTEDIWKRMMDHLWENMKGSYK